ncbi:MAG: hypothetical protein LC775_12930, partial [Acidobacteria bacterium]|nr:hypothetical protein [Acidobacteriota bacterium]
STESRTNLKIISSLCAFSVFLCDSVVKKTDVSHTQLKSALCRQQGFKRQQVVALDNQIAVESWVLALAQYREFGIKFQRVVRDGVMIVLDRSLALELKDWHLS